MRRPFIKMNGLGNDFVVVEASVAPFNPTPKEVRAIADRKKGIGCDQVISIESSVQADARMRVWNADGTEVTMCGNGARCVAWLIMKAAGSTEALIETPKGLLSAALKFDGMVEVDMGPPAVGWRKIPLSRPMDTVELNLEIEAGVGGPGVVSMGNPHAVFFVGDAETAPIEQAGPVIERHILFPEGVNAGFAEIKSRELMRLRVWERGVGVTKACGTAACAAVVAAYRRRLVGRRVLVEMDGGDLHIEWRDEDRHVLMTGPAEVEFTGLLPEPARA